MVNKVEIQISVDMDNEESAQKFMNQLEQLKDSAGVIETKVEVDGEEQLDDVEEKIDDIDGDTANVPVKVDDDELDSAKEKEEELSGEEEVKIKVDENAVQNAMQNISQGFATLKQGAAELGQALSGALESAGKQETNFTFLQHALNNDEALAKQKMQNIAQIVQKLPGDDTAVQGLLSQAIAKDASLAEDQLQKIGTAYADYASAMSFYGKSSIEAQQDMTNYILAGNTAELERSPILASHIEKLKEANTIQERSQVLQEALNEEHWGGMSQQDTFNNKLETFNGMLERGKYQLGGMFQEGAKRAMDLALRLDDASGGLVGMGLAALSFASPLSDMVIGVGQIATGLNALKSAGAASALAGMLPFIVADEEAFLGLALAEDFALWPILAIIAALALLGAAVYEVGKYFGWWTDVGSMIDAVTAGVTRLWSAFINNPDVQGFIKGLGDAWNSIISTLGQVVSAVMKFFGVTTANGEKIDVVRMIIDGVGAAFHRIANAVRFAIGVFQTIFGVFQAIYTFLQPYGEAIYNFLKPIVCILLGCSPGIVPALQRVQEVFSSVWTAIAGFIGSYVSTIVSVIMTIVNAVMNVINIFSQFLNGQISLTDMLVMLWQNYNAMFTSILNILAGFVMSWGSRILGIFVSAVRSWITSAVSGARNLVNQVHSAISALPGKVTSALSGIANKFSQPFRDAWNMISPWIDKVKSGISTVRNLIPTIPSLGFDGSFGFTGDSYGFDGFDSSETLNTKELTSYVSSSQGDNITNNFYINGIIEEEASEYIVGSVNDYIRKQNLIRGV